jgi:hypothetical protein
VTDEFHDEMVQPGAVGLPAGFFDRFMFNMHPTQGTAPSIIMGLGHYPTKDVADGFAVVTTGGEQRNVRFSTELVATDGDGVEPLGFEVVVPNRCWRLRLLPNPTGLELDVTWHARTPYCVKEVEVVNRSDLPTRFEHLVQSGRYTGSLAIDGVERSVDGWYGQRDRSRGVRSMDGGQGLHIWCQAQFPDRSVGFLLVQNREHGRLLLEGAVMHEDGTIDDVVDVQHDLVFDELDLKTGTVDVKTATGQSYTVGVDGSAGGGFMAGAGYGGHHGRRRGRNHLEHDVYPLDGSVSQRTLDSSLTDRLCTFDWNGTRGVGVFEFALTRSESYGYRPTRTPGGRPQTER